MNHDLNFFWFTKHAFSVILVYSGGISFPNTDNGSIKIGKTDVAWKICKGIKQYDSMQILSSLSPLYNKKCKGPLGTCSNFFFLRARWLLSWNITDLNPATKKVQTFQCYLNHVRDTRSFWSMKSHQSKPLWVLLVKLYFKIAYCFFCWSLSPKYQILKCGLSRSKKITEKALEKRKKPDVGVEPTTLRLRVSRSTDWASRAFDVCVTSNVHRIPKVDTRAYVPSLFINITLAFDGNIFQQSSSKWWLSNISSYIF